MQQCWLTHKPKVDNYDEAIEKLNRLSEMLYGGYYEPKSERDVILAQKIDKLLKELE